jgi:hypothetical protein
MINRMIAIAALLVLVACHSRLQANDLPALLTSPTPASRAELVNVVSKALNGLEVTLADDALTNSSTLIIERKQLRDIRGRIDSGRVMEMPEFFDLVINGSSCVLIHRQDESRYDLKEAVCRRF